MTSISHPHHPTRLSRRALALLGLATFSGAGAARAQEPTTITANTSESAPIISSLPGEVPTTGGRRPGPFNQPALIARRSPGLTPVTLTVAAVGIDAQIEALEVVNGVMQDPSGPWDVAWYRNLASLGEGDNVVMAGHIDYWNVGPAVFYSIDDLAEGDEIQVTAEDGQAFTYAVEWVRQYPADEVPLDEVVGATNRESLTLITCGGTFDYITAQYLHRTVVRAAQIPATDA